MLCPAGPDGDTALHLACLYGHKACVDALVAAGCKLDPVNSEDGTSPLHDAAAGGYLDIVTLLLDKAGAGMVPLQVCAGVREGCGVRGAGVVIKVVQ